jgi:DNA polymerase-1
MGNRRISVDTETEMVDYGPGGEFQITNAPVPRLCVMSWATPGSVGLIHNKDPELVPTARKLFERETIWANPCFDAAVLIEHEDSLLRPIFEAFDAGRVKDVLLRETIIDLAEGQYNTWSVPKPHPQYSLGGIMLRRFHVNLDKDTWRKRYGELIDTHLEEWPAEAVEYPKVDAVSNLQLFEDQETRRAAFAVEEDGIDFLQDEDNQVRASLFLHLMGVHGVLVDPEKVKAFEAGVVAAWEKAKARLIKAGLVRSDGTRDMKAAQARMVAAGGTKETATGQPCLDAEACIDSQDPILVDYADYGSLLKLKSTYIAPMKLAGDLPIHPRWNTMVTTGRTSCARPNLQQLPQAEGVRQCYRARPGRLFVGRDYGSAEFVAFAQVALDLFKHSDIAEAMREGKDVHVMVAATILGISYVEAKARHDADPASIHNERQLGKIGNYGFLGGLGPNKFAGNVWRKTMKTDNPVRMTVEEAAELKSNWLQTWSEAPEFFRMVSKACSDGPGNMRSIRSGRCHGNKGYTDMCNAYMQMLVADMAKDAGWRVTKRQYLEPSSALFGSNCVIFPHDELVIEADESKAKAAGEELGEVMLEAARDWMPDVKMTVGPAVIGTHWSNH